MKHRAEMTPVKQNNLKPLLNFFKAASVCESLFFNIKTTGAVALGQSQSQKGARFWFFRE
jgi:hypothetical protein